MRQRFKPTGGTAAPSLFAALLFALGGGHAMAAPPDSGNCWGSFVNGGENGAGVAADAGPRYGQTIAPLVAGGAVGDLVSSAECRPQGS
jgi:hypothetical protein